jgi:ankyrin repeat protein
MNLCLERAANLEIKNKYGETPLHQAVTRLNVDMMVFLLACGADPNACNECEVPLDHL